MNSKYEFECVTGEREMTAEGHIMQFGVFPLPLACFISFYACVKSAKLSSVLPQKILAHKCLLSLTLLAV